MANKDIYLGSGPVDPNLKRSTYDMSFTNHMSAKFGLIYPCYLQEMNPDETLTIQPTAAFDLMPMVFPLQSRITMHMSFYKCAFRNLWKKYKDVVSRVGNHIFPYISRNYPWHGTGTLADYMGVASYSNRPLIEWTDVKPFAVDDESLKMLQRGFYNVSGTDGSKANFRLKDGRIIELQHGSSLFNHFSANQLVSPGATSYASVLYDIQNIPLCVSQPWLQFTIVSPTTISKLETLRVGLVAYYHSGEFRNESSGYVSFLGAELTGNLTLATDFSAITDRTYQLVNSKQSMLDNRSPVYYYTFVAKLDPLYVTLFNELSESGLYCRPFFAYTYNDLNQQLFGFRFQPATNNVQLPASPGSQLAQSYSFSNGHYTGISGTHYLSSAGIQRNIMMRTETSANKSDIDSPFIIKTGETDPELPVSALPFRMYQFIYNLRFRNTQIDPFIKNGQPTYNEYLTNDGDGADSTTPVDFFHARYEDDFLTTAKFSPQAGNAPLVGISYVDGAEEAVFHFLDENDQPVNLRLAVGTEGNLTGISEYGSNANESTIKNLDAMIQFGISINDFRNVSAFQRFLERFQRAGFDYKSIVKEFFGTNAPIGEEFPEYLGGFTKQVSIGKIENLAESEKIPLGSFAGVGSVSETLKDNEKIRCFASERSLVMGLIWFTVTPVYPQAMQKFWFKNNHLDFFNPQFATIGNQPIHNYEVAPLQASDNDELMSVFGYQRPWYEYTMRLDEVHGQFRDTLHNYLLQREFQTMPMLGKSFIEVNADDLTDVFSVTQGTDKIFGAIRFDVKSESPVPKFINPSIVG